MAEALRRIVRDAPGRVIVTSFASHIHRLQEVIDAAVACRPAGLRGRPLDDQEPQHRPQPRLRRACPTALLVKPQDLDELPADSIVILCTGSQGEPLSALTRIAYDDHQTISVRTATR